MLEKVVVLRGEVERLRKSRVVVLVLVYLALVLDNMLLTVVVPIIPDYLYQLELQQITRRGSSGTTNYSAMSLPASVIPFTPSIPSTHTRHQLSTIPSLKLTYKTMAAGVRGSRFKTLIGGKVERSVEARSITQTQHNRLSRSLEESGLHREREVRRKRMSPDTAVKTVKYPIIAKVRDAKLTFGPLSRSSQYSAHNSNESKNTRLNNIPGIIKELNNKEVYPVRKKNRSFKSGYSKRNHEIQSAETYYSRTIKYGNNLSQQAPRPHKRFDLRNNFDTSHLSLPSSPATSFNLESINVSFWLLNIMKQANSSSQHQHRSENKDLLMQSSKKVNKTATPQTFRGLLHQMTQFSDASLQQHESDRKILLSTVKHVSTLKPPPAFSMNESSLQKPESSKNTSPQGKTERIASRSTLYLTTFATSPTTTKDFPLRKSMLHEPNFPKATSLQKAPDRINRGSQQDPTTNVNTSIATKSEKLPEHIISENGRVGLLFSSKAFVQLLVNPFIGPLTSHIGYSVPLVVGTHHLIIAALLFAYAQSYALMFVARSLQGVASSFIAIAGMGIVAECYPDDSERGRMQGLVMGGIALGVLAGYPLGSLLYDFTNSKTPPFLLVAALTAILAVVQLIVLNPRPHAERVVGGTPLSQLVRDPYILVTAGAIMVSTSTLAVLEPCLPIWLTSTLHLQKWQLGTAFLPDSVGYLVGTSCTAGPAFRLGRWRAALIAMVMVGLAAASVPEARSMVGLALPHLMLGLGVGTVDAALMPHLAALVDARHVAAYGAVYAVAQAAVAFAYFLGPLVGGAVVERIGFPWLMRAMALLNFCYCPVLYCLSSFNADHSTEPEALETQAILMSAPRPQDYTRHVTTPVQPRRSSLKYTRLFDEDD